MKYLKESDLGNYLKRGEAQEKELRLKSLLCQTQHSFGLDSF